MFKGFQEFPFNQQDLMNMTEFVLNNNVFGFSSRTYQQKLDAAIRTKFEHLYTYIYIDKGGKNSIEKQSNNQLRYILNGICFFLDILGTIFEGFTQPYSNLRLTHEASKSCISFFDIKLNINKTYRSSLLPSLVIFSSRVN